MTASPIVLFGRVYVTTYSDRGRLVEYVHVDATASRLHGASIAGLAVGAMGLFVFSLALRHWLKERGSSGQGTHGA